MPEFTNGYVYVVTRDGRRVSGVDHASHDAAAKEAELWLRIKANWDPHTKVEVRKTDDPKAIR